MNTISQQTFTEPAEPTSKKRTPLERAARVSAYVGALGMYVRDFATVVFWLVAAATVGGAGFIALRTLWWAAKWTIEVFQI